PLAQGLADAAAHVAQCSQCGNLDTTDPCAICADARRDGTHLCVVEDVADLWAIERSGAFAGRYHVLGGTLSALEGVGPEELRVEQLVARVARDGVGGAGGTPTGGALTPSINQYRLMVPVKGLEPPLPCEKRILSPSRLPFRHTGGTGAGG